MKFAEDSKIPRCLSNILAVLVISCLLAAFLERASAQVPPSAKSAEPQSVIIDTDIGDDVDDVFALGLALNSPEIKIVGITSAWGNTKLRAKMILRLLKEVGRSDIPVAVGIEKHHAGEGAFSQERWAKAGPDAASRGDAVDFLLHQIQDKQAK